jgi:hypothetical protein
LNVKKLNDQDTGKRGFLYNLESMGKMNIWLLNEIIEKEIFENIVKPEFLLRSMCLIVVDLSRVRVSSSYIAMGDT